MFREFQTEVLIIGAGPIGMFTALCLAETGVQVRIIDQEERTAARSYACALHPRILKMLNRFGLLPELFALGRKIHRVAFYEGDARRAELRLSDLDTEFPYALALPQSALEDSLERRLNESKQIGIQWNHRLAGLELHAGGVLATVDKLCESCKGYSVPEMDWEVEKTIPIEAAFVVGADGSRSLVRQRMGVEFEVTAKPATFQIYQFKTAAPIEDELRVVMDSTATSALWPLPDNRARWTLQSRSPEENADIPMKERTDLLLVEPAHDIRVLSGLRKVVSERAPWFRTDMSELDWFAETQFEPRLVRRFGRDREWLVGDAGHQSGPIGMQSMNVGLCEAEELALKLSRVLHGEALSNLLDSYNWSRADEWHQLLDVGSALVPSESTDPWVKSHSDKILPCIPSSGSDLSKLARQLGLELQPVA